MPALAYADAGTFMAELHKDTSIAARCLEFTILCACRSGESFGARFEEIQGDTWVVPADRTKSHREHKVPLPSRAVEIVEAMREIQHGDHHIIFPGRGRNGAMNGTAMRCVVDRIWKGITVHGWRATFRTWCAECTNYPREIGEAALGHHDEEMGYQRGPLLEKRRRLMEEWSRFCSMPKVEGEVRKLRA